MSATRPPITRTERGLVLTGTRITLYDIMDFLAAGRSPEDIRDRWRLSDRQVADAQSYIDAHRAEVDAEYADMLRAAEEERRYWEERNRERFAQIAAMPPRTDHHEARAKLQELLQEEHETRRPTVEYPEWSPYDAVEAADMMLTVLRSAEAQDRAQR